MIEQKERKLKERKKTKGKCYKEGGKTKRKNEGKKERKKTKGRGIQ